MNNEKDVKQQTVDAELIKEITEKLIANGNLIEAGFVGLRLSVMDPSAPEIQVREMRMSFFAGAQHVMTSIMQVLDPGSEPTDDDLKRFESIMRELERFRNELLERIKKGSH